VQRSAGEAHRSSSAPPPCASDLIGLQRAAGNRAVGAVLARRRARGSARGQRGAAGERVRAAAPRIAVQRSIDDLGDALFGSLDDAITEGIGGVRDALASAKEKTATLADLATYPSCETTLGGPAPKPDLAAWLDNEGLEVLRHGEGELLSRSHVPSGGDRGATRLVKQALQAWGCERFGRDLLPKYGTSGPFGSETAQAVKQLQLFSWLSIDGVIGRETMAALDSYLGVRPASRVPMSVGGTTEKGESTWSRFGVPAGRIYFVTDGATLDADDKAVLESMADDIMVRVDEITLNVVGYADKREHALYNVELADGRAKAVRVHLIKLLEYRKLQAILAGRSGLKYAVDWKSKGEIERPQFGETAEELKPFRRVDVHIVEFEPRSTPTCETTEPTTEWQVRHRNMQTIGPGRFGLVDIQMARPDSRGRRWSQTFKFGGVVKGVSPRMFPSISGDSAFASFTTTVPLRLDQFEGSARFSTIGAAVGEYGWSADVLTISGIEDHGADPETIEWAGTGTGVYLGPEAGLWGRLTSYGECVEVTVPSVP